MPLGDDYPIEFDKTRMRVLRHAAHLFAVYGFEGVSMNEIAQAVGIKAPSLYNHFENKDQILDAVFTTATEWMEEYYRRFKEEDQHAKTLEESIENIFIEIRRVVDPFIFQATALSQRYAGSNPLAYRFFNDSFYNAGIKSITACLIRGQAKGYVPAGVHTEGFATLMMDFVAHNNMYWSLVDTEVYLHRRTQAWYDRMQQYFVNMVKAGV